MRKALIGGCICLGICGLLFLSGCGSDGESTAQAAQTTCPMTGKPIDKQYYVDHQGKRIYMCCDDCPAVFEKDPETYMKKLTGVTLEDAPK